MNRIKTKIHDTTDRIKGLRSTETEPLKIGWFFLLAILFIFTAVPFIVIFSSLGLTVLGFALGITEYLSSLAFLVGVYKYPRCKKHISLWYWLTIISLVLLILLFSPFIIFFYIYDLLTTKLHLYNLRRNLDLVLLRFVLFIFTFGIIFTASIIPPDILLLYDNIVVKLILVLVFAVYNLLKIGLVHMAVPGKEKIYSRYKINREFQYIDDFFLSLCLLVKQFVYENGFDSFFSFFLIISAIYAAMKTAQYFKSNINHTNCLQKILSDLENCIDCLALADPKTELRVRINIDTTFLRGCYKNGSKKVKEAIESIYSLVFSETAEGNEEQGKNSKIHCPFTYNCTAAQMKKNIEKTLNYIVKAL